MTEWIYEAGIGENRAALIQDGEIVQVAIEVIGDGLRAGAVVPARLRANRIIDCEGGEQALLDAVPPNVSEGAAILALITREALPEPGKPKRAKARLAGAILTPQRAPTLLERITDCTELSLHAPDALEAAGWSEVIECAQSGLLEFEGGALQISLTPTMTLIDIDGQLDPASLGVEGAGAAARAIRAFEISGSIGIDFPTTQSKAERLAIADAFDREMPMPFERTAVNGYGFMQIIRPRARASLCELLAADPIGHAARALIRRVQRAGMIGSVTIVAGPQIASYVEARTAWLAELSAQLGGSVSLRIDAALSIGAGYAER